MAQSDDPRTGALDEAILAQTSLMNPQQPLEVVKTTMAANRGDSFASALSRVWARGGVLGCEH